MQALELFTKACSKYQEAYDLPREHGERAVRLYREASELFEQLVRSGFEHPDVYYNLGNAYFKVNDLGRAVLNYRRAERFTPSDADLAENLRAAKSKVLDQEPDRRPPELVRTLLFWHYETSLLFLAKAALGCYLLLCAALGAHIFVRKAPLRWLAKALAVLTVALTLSCAVRLYQDKTQKVAVVLAAEAPVRTGYSEKETAKFTVHAGAELRVEDTREVEGARWLKVALSTDLRGWIRGDAVEVVQERPAAELGPKP
jgi:tetratricopeptide (TPR) repeat protein